MTEDEFMDVVLWPRKKLWTVCSDITKKYGHIAALNILMKTRRNIQEGLSRYSKGKSKIDPIQAKAVWMTEMIMKWCGQYYKAWAMRQILKNKPELSTQPQKLKGMMHNAWEQYAKKYSY